MKNIVSLQIDKCSNEPLYLQLYKSLRGEIEKGRISDGDRLPSIRKTAQSLGLNNSTVINAYRLLEEGGYAYTRMGSGTYVRGKNISANERGFNIVTPNEIKVRQDAINFANYSPDAGLFPVSDFKSAMNEVMDRDGGSAFGYTEIKGYKPLRRYIAEYMNKYGVKCSDENIYIITGAQQGIDIIAKVLVDYGDLIITERPTYTGAVAVFKSRRSEIIDVPVNSNGMDIEMLENILKRVSPEFIYIMANFQNPTGVSYSHEVKERLLSLSEKYDFYIIEDDYLLELYYGGSKPKTLKSMDINNRVIYIKSFSKIFMPGVRLGFLIVPEAIEEKVMAAKHLSDISTSGFMQRVLELYIRKGMLENHMDNIRQVYASRYKSIISMIDEKLKGVEYCKPNGGLHLWLKLPDGISSNLLYTRCLNDNVIISPGSAFYMDGLDSPYLRLSYSSVNEDCIIKGIQIIKDNIYSIKTNNYDTLSIPMIYGLSSVNQGNY